MVGSPAEEYPPLPEFTGTATLTLPASGLKWLIDRTHFCVCTDDNRYGINGGHLELSESEDGPRLRMVGTDGHRLSYAEAGFTGDFGMPAARLLPRKALGEMRKLAERGDEALTLTFSDNGALLETSEGRFFFRLIDGEFPGYREIIPSTSQRRVVIARGLLLAAVKRVGLLASDQTRPVRFAFEGDHLTLSTQNLDIGEAREEVPCELDGEDITVGFNGRYFSEALAATTGDQVMIELSDPLMPALLKEQDQDEGLFVIMPMRLD
jgi:DNA polymerase-3 subunit beta